MCSCVNIGLGPETTNQILGLGLELQFFTGG